jgi:hypothetical protein
MPANNEEPNLVADFLQAHPEYYKIANAGIYVKLLMNLADSAKDLPALYLDFPNVENTDLEQMLDLLLKLRMIERMELSDKTLYYATENTKKFLELYRQSRGVKV